MATESTVLDAPAAAAAPASGNITTEQLAQMVARSRRAKAASGSAPAAATRGTQGSPAPAPEASTTQQPETAPPAEAASNQPATGEESLEETNLLTGGTEGEGQATEPTIEGIEGEETGEEEGQEAETEPRDPAKTIAKLQKRIHRQTAKYARELETLREEMKQLKQGGGGAGQAKEAPLENAPMLPMGDDAFSWRPEIQELNEELRNKEAILRYAEENPDGGEVQHNGKTVTLDATQVRTLATRASREVARLESQKAARIERLNQEDGIARRQHSSEALQSYPWLKNKTTAEYQEAVEVLQQNPGILARPDYLLMIGDYVAGRRLRQAKGKAGTNGTHKPQGKPPLSIVTGPASSAPALSPVDQVKKKYADAIKAFQANGSMENQARLIAIRRQLKAALAGA